MEQKKRPFQVRQFVKNEIGAVKQDIRKIGLLGAVVMLWVVVSVIMMVYTRSVWNAVVLYMVGILAVVVLILLFQIEKLDDYVKNVEDWYEVSKRDYEKRKKGEEDIDYKKYY